MGGFTKDLDAKRHEIDQQVQILQQHLSLSQRHFSSLGSLIILKLKAAKP